MAQRETCQAGRTVLVAEGDRILSRLIRRALEHGGFAVEEVRHGEQALAWLGQHENAVLVSDYRLADMTARELMERRAAQGREPPFVVLTDYRHHRPAAEMTTAGAGFCLIKSAANLQEILPQVVRHLHASLATQCRLQAAEAALRGCGQRHEGIERCPTGRQNAERPVRCPSRRGPPPAGT